MEKKFSNMFPLLGSGLSAAYEGAEIFGTLIELLIVTIVGGSIGYFVKMFWDHVFNNTKTKK